MKPFFTTRLLWLLWFAAVALFVAVWLFPISNGITRSSGVVLLSIVWFGLIALLWRRRFLLISLLCLTILIAAFLAMPAHDHPDATALRSAYVAGLHRYEGANYYWGGESPKGIDCSGLIRRGLIDSLFLQGIRALDGGEARDAIWLWWHDCTARDLGEGHGLTHHLFDTPSINALDHSRVLPGDLAVTSSGTHIMAYAGDKQWIEADPGIGRVVTVTAPAGDNLWFKGQMKIVRWNIFQ